jgi:hypothetical protein
LILLDRSRPYCEVRGEPHTIAFSQDDRLYNGSGIEVDINGVEIGIAPVAPILPVEVPPEIPSEPKARLRIRRP